MNRAEKKDAAIAVSSTLYSRGIVQEDRSSKKNPEKRQKFFATFEFNLNETEQNEVMIDLERQQQDPKRASRTIGYYDLIPQALSGEHLSKLIDKDEIWFANTQHEYDGVRNVMSELLQTTQSKYHQWPLAEGFGQKLTGYIDVERKIIKILVLGGKGHKVNKNVEFLECHNIRTRQEGGPKLVNFGTCGRTGPMSEDSIVLLEVKVVTDPVTEKNPPTLESASFDESEFPEILTRTGFKPADFRVKKGKKLTEDRLEDEEKKFNKEIIDLCDKLKYKVKCGPIFSSSYKVELWEEQRHLLRRGFIAVDMESSRFRRLARAEKYHVNMVRAYADSCQSFQEADQKSKSEQRRQAIQQLAEIFNRK